MATDGLWDVMSAAEVVRVVELERELQDLAHEGDDASHSRWCARAARRLMLESRARGVIWGGDNVGVGVLRL